MVELVELEAKKKAIFNALVHARACKDKLSVARLERELKSVHAEIKAAKAVPSEAEGSSVDAAAAAISSMQFRQWRQTAKIRVYFADNRQYPCYSVAAYYPSKEEAQTSLTLIGDDYINSALVSANCETIAELENSGKINLKKIWENS